MSTQNSKKWVSIREKQCVTDFAYLKDHNADVFCTYTNEAGQKIEILEDPVYGDECSLWISFPDYEVAFLSHTYDIDDINKPNQDGTPIFINTKGVMVFRFELDDLGINK